MRLKGSWVTASLAVPLGILSVVGAALVASYNGASQNLFPFAFSVLLDSFLLIACGLAGVASLRLVSPEDRFKVSIVTFALFGAAAMLFWWVNSFPVTG